MTEYPALKTAMDVYPFHCIRIIGVKAASLMHRLWLMAAWIQVATIHSILPADNGDAGKTWHCSTRDFLRYLPRLLLPRIGERRALVGPRHGNFYFFSIFATYLFELPGNMAPIMLSKTAYREAEGKTGQGR